MSSENIVLLGCAAAVVILNVALSSSVFARMFGRRRSTSQDESPTEANAAKRA